MLEFTNKEAKITKVNKVKFELKHGTSGLNKVADGSVS